MKVHLILQETFSPVQQTPKVFKKAATPLCGHQVKTIFGWPIKSPFCEVFSSPKLKTENEFGRKSRGTL